jgi:hypothetical protein
MAAHISETNQAHEEAIHTYGTYYNAYQALFFFNSTSFILIALSLN